MARLVTPIAMASFVRIDLPPWRLSRLSTVPLIESVTGRHLACDVDHYGIAFPVFDQLLLAKISVHELLGELVAAKLQKLDVRLHPPIKRHRDLPWLGIDLGIVDRRLVPD